MKRYVCIAECFPGRFVRVGEIVGEQLVAHAPAKCFKEITSTEPEAVKSEIEEKTGVPQDESPKVFSNADIVKAKRTRKIAGSKAKKE